MLQSLLLDFIFVDLPYLSSVNIRK